MQGRIQYWNDKRGFGFIVTKTTTYYFHARNFSGQPVVGGRVRFDLGPSLAPDKPPQAINVVNIEEQVAKDVAALVEGVMGAMKDAGGTK